MSTREDLAVLGDLGERLDQLFAELSEEFVVADRLCARRCRRLPDR